MTPHAPSPRLRRVAKAKAKAAGAPTIDSKCELAIEELAKVLHWKMEHLDPTDGGEWEDMSDDEREIFRQCVKALLRRGSLLSAANALYRRTSYNIV